MDQEIVREVTLYVGVEHGDEDILVCDAHFDYQPKEQQTRDYPGCPESITLNRVMYKGIDLWLVLSETQREQVVHQLMEEQYED